MCFGLPFGLVPWSDIEDGGAYCLPRLGCSMSKLHYGVGTNSLDISRK